MPTQTIFLIGFMGSGKTTIGKQLAEELNIKFVDLDEEISTKYQVSSIKTLIEERGIDFFRKAEGKTLKSLFLKNKVIATGGGTPCYFDNLDWMKKNGTVVFLNVPKDVLFAHLKNTDLEERPLLKNLDDEGLRKFIHEKLEERLPFYELAHLKFAPVENDLQNLIGAIDSAIKNG